MEKKAQSALNEDAVFVKAQGTVEKLSARYAATKTRIPPGYARFYALIVQGLVFPSEIHKALDFSAPIENQISNLVRALQRFPDDYAKLSEFVASKRGLDLKTVNPETIVRTYGAENSRVLLLSIALSVLTKGKKFEWDPHTGQPKNSPDQSLKNAIKVSTLSNPSTVTLAFSAGLIFDVLTALAQKLLPDPKQMLKFIDSEVDREIRTSAIAMSVAKHTTDLKLANYLYSACYLAAAGRCTLALLNPEFISFQEKLSADDLPPSAELLCEEVRFGASSDRYASLICMYFPAFQQIHEALYLRRRPYVLKHRGRKDLHRLASFVCLSNHLARHSKMSGPDDARIKEKWLRPEIKDVGLSPDVLFSVMKNVSS